MKRSLIAGAAAAVLATGAVVADRRIRTVRRTGVAALDAFAPPEPVRAGFVRADDRLRLYYELDGPDEADCTVVLVHGFCLNRDDLVPQRRALIDRFGDGIRIVSFDLRSHGKSERSTPDRATIDQLGADLRAVIDALAPTGSLVLIGHSMGGMTVLALADAHPELFGARVKAVGLLGTSTGKVAALSLGVPAALTKLSDPLVGFALRGASSRSAFVERLRARERRLRSEQSSIESFGSRTERSEGRLVTDVAWAFVQRLAFGPKPDPALVEFITQLIGATPVDVIAEFYPALMSHDKVDALKVLDGLPVAIICGADDLITPVEHSEAMAAALPTAELVVIPDVGHQAHLERPDLANPPLLRLMEHVG